MRSAWLQRALKGADNARRRCLWLHPTHRWLRDHGVAETNTQLAWESSRDPE